MMRKPHDGGPLSRQRGVGTRPFFLGLHEQPVFRAKGWYSTNAFP